MASRNENANKKTINSLQDLSKYIVVDEEASDTPAATPAPSPTTYTEYMNGTYNVVSLMAYLVGVEKNKFGADGAAPYLLDIYTSANNNKDARIIRNLCRLRNAMEQKYMAIVRKFQTDICNIGSIPDLIPSDAYNELSSDGISIYKSKPDVDEYLIAINIEVQNRINNVKTMFPEWLKWEYIKPIFLMPDGTKKSGLKASGELYNQDRNRYPYSCWVNWDAFSIGLESKGNVLYNDEKFVTTIYERNQDRFENLSLVRDVGNKTMRNLSNLLEHSKKCVMMVDCENSDAVKLAAAISSLPIDQSDKIHKIILLDSNYTTDMWRTMVDKTMHEAVMNPAQLEIDHVIVDRINQSKSQVDMALAMRTSREVLTNGIDSVILVSSDCDYWAMISGLPEVRFLVMLEYEKTGMAILDSLVKHDIPFCYIDDFCTAASYKIKTATLLNHIQLQIDNLLGGTAGVPFNLRAMMHRALNQSWISMTEKEKEAFYDRYLRQAKMSIDADGMVHVKVGE